MNRKYQQLTGGRETTKERLGVVYLTNRAITPESTMRKIIYLLGIEQLRQDTQRTKKVIETWRVDRTAGGLTYQTPSRGPLRLMLRWAELCIRHGRSDIVMDIIYLFLTLLYPADEGEMEKSE
jgi:hypothetical protein